MTETRKPTPADIAALVRSGPQVHLAVDLSNPTEEDRTYLDRPAEPLDLQQPRPPGSPDVMSAAAQKGAAAFDYAYQQQKLEFARDCELAESTEFGAVFRKEESDETLSYAFWAQSAAELYNQQELDLSGPNFRAAVRGGMAARFHALRHIPRAVSSYQSMSERLEGARKRGARYFNHELQKFRTEWDTKAGLNLYCPDDARDNARRLDKRYRPALLKCHKAGLRLQYAVLTMPNCAPGELKRMQRRQFRALQRRILKKRRKQDGSLVFPEIKGALVVQESPLGWNRDWHPHLNVMFVVDRFLEFGKLQHHWGHIVHIDPPLGRGLPEAEVDKCIGGALREIIKYAVTAVSAKSQHKAEHGKSGDRPAPPGMLDWTDDELLEYDRANLFHHRTRTFGCLRGVPKPPKVDRGQETFLGWRNLTAQGYRDDLPLLKSILGKISTPPTGIERWLSIKKGAGPPGLAGAGQLGHSIERDALHKALDQLQKM